MTEEDNGYQASIHMHDDDLLSLSADQQKRLARWMGRIAERAYRRGVQQALYLSENGRIDDWIMNDVHAYRYDKSLDISIGLDGFTTTSLERLMIEENIENFLPECTGTKDD